MFIEKQINIFNLNVFTGSFSFEFSVEIYSRKRVCYIITILATFHKNKMKIHGSRAGGRVLYMCLCMTPSDQTKKDTDLKLGTHTS